MALELKTRTALSLLAGLAVLALIPIGLKWAEKRDDPMKRLAREKLAAEDAVATAAKRDLACEMVVLKEPGGELWAHGCGRRARYVPTPDGTYRLDGKVEPEDTDESGCVATWTTGKDAGTAREAAAAVHASGKPARIRIPIGAFGVTGLPKLRYGEHVEVFVELDAGVVPDLLTVPCIDPSADGGVREGRCTKEWSAVSEVDACR